MTDIAAWQGEYHVRQIPISGHEGPGGQNSGSGKLPPKKVTAIFINVEVTHLCDHPKGF